MGLLFHLIAQVSIHAPTKGATEENIRRGGCSSCFNPRSHEGSDRGNQSCACKGAGFNPRSHEGSDAPSCMGLVRIASFNPRSHEGSDGNSDNVTRVA